MRLVTTKYQLVCNTIFALFWFLATYNFIVQEIAGREMPAIEFAGRLASQGIILVLGLWTLRKKFDIIVIAVFTIFTLIGTCYINGRPFSTWADGVRLYECLLFIVPILRYLLSDKQFRSYFVTRMDRNLYLFLWLQAPCIIFQASRYGNLDLVGGSLGYMMSGVISNLIYMVSFYLMLRAWDYKKSYLSNLMENKSLVFLLFLTFLNETKVSFIFLMMYFFFLIPMDKKFLKRFLSLLPLGIIMICGAAYVYISITGNRDGITSQAKMARYIMGDDAALDMVENVMEKNYEFIGDDMARGLKFIITPAIMNRNPPAWIWGYGIGIYKVGDSANKNEFARRYDWLLQGTVIQIHVIWLEIGLGGILLYILYWLSLFNVFSRRPVVNKQLLGFLATNVILVSIYNAPFLMISYCIIFFYMALLIDRWKEIPPYKPLSILGRRPIKWSLKSKAKQIPQD